MFRFKQILLLSLLGLVPLMAQTPAPAVAASGTNTPSAVPPPAAIPLGDVISQAESALVTLQSDQSQFAADPVIQAAIAQLPALSQRIDAQLAEDKRLRESDPALANLQKSQDTWLAITKDIAAIKTALTSRANKISDLNAQLGQEAKTWQTTLTSNKTAPPEAMERIKAVLTTIEATSKSALALQNQIVSVQSQVSEQDLRANGGMTSISQAQEEARKKMFEQDHPPLWAQSLTSLAAHGVSEENNSFQEQWSAAKAYLTEKLPSVGLNLLLFILLIFGLYGMRNSLRTMAEKETALQNAEKAFATPLATALLLSLLAYPWLYPLAPRLVSAAVWTIALIPAIIILRRLLEPALFPILYALVAAYLADQLRHALIPSGAFARLLVIFELVAECLFIIWLLKSKRLTSHLATTRFERWGRPYLHLALWVLVFAGGANIFGYVRLSIWAGQGMLECSYLAIVFYAAVRIIDAVVFSALNIPPFTSFRSVASHRNLIYGNLSSIINWIALALWLMTALEVFKWRDPAWHAANHLFGHAFFKWGPTNDSHTLSLGDLLIFGLTLWGTFLLSRFLRFILEEEVYPHLSLGRGVPYVASTIVHYAVLVAGCFIALNALGIHLLDNAFLMTSLGVGLGFGLQNILNNFVSGIILLFERPIKVGDTLQMDAGTGVVESIGIRASIIRLANGSSIIVPNGNLISNPVTNWSLRDNRRMIEIPISVTSKVEPPHILELLRDVAKANKQVLKRPEPQSLLVTLSGAALAFRLRVWVDAETDWNQVTSDLSLAINTALAKENILFS